MKRVTDLKVDHKQPSYSRTLTQTPKGKNQLNLILRD